MKLRELTGEYAQYLRITASYHKGGSYITDHKVMYWLQIGQALGLPAPRTDNHASKIGGGGEQQKAKEEEENFEGWRKEHLGALTSVSVQESTPVTKHLVSAEQRRQGEENRVKKMEKKAEGKERREQDFRQGQVCLGDKGRIPFDPAVHVPTTKTVVCPHCRRKFV